MATRVLIQLEGTEATLPAEVRALLESVGAGQIRASHPELAGLYTATIPDEVDLAGLLEQLKLSRGVRHAEADSFRSSL